MIKMMKLKYIKSYALASSLLMLAACSDNSWNNTFLDGFEGGATYDESVTVQYTLTTTDYETIGKALYNIAETPEEKAAANAIQSNHYFDQNSPYPAQIAVPYLLNKEQSNFFIYNNGSIVEVSLTQAETPAEITSISAAKTMTITEEVSPSAIPGILLNEYPDAVEGDYAIVTVDAGSSSSESPVWTVAQALSRMKDGFEGEATVKGIISSVQEISTSFGNATYFIKDNLGDEESLEVFRGYYLDNTKFTSEDQLQVGATVVVTGNLVNYNGTLEFTSGNYITSYEAPATKSRAATLTSNIKDLSKDDLLTATAIVTAQSTRGLILTDDAGSIFYYNNNVDLDTYTIGTVVNVVGKVSEYGTGFQLSNSAALTVVGKETYTYPAPTVYSAEMIEAAISSTTLNTATYVTYEGELSLSNNYYNINIEGVTNGQGSLYTPTEALIAKMENGKTYKFTGYFTGVTNGKFFYMVLTDVEAVSGGGNPGGGNTGGDNPGNDNPGSGDNTDNEDEVTVNIYKFNGTAWAIADDAVVMQPSDYAALGLQNNKLTDPAIYLPLYMKAAYPYTAAGTEKFVAYNIGNNSCASALMEYDGANWKYVDNYIENKVAAFAKSAGEYKFRKYIGEEIFKFYDGEKIGLNCSYLIVYGGVCMVPVPAGKSYGYPAEADVTITDNQIIQPNGDNAFTFTTTTEYNGNVYTTPEGYFLIQDSNGRYMYLQGTYSSFNLRSNNAYIESDGTISVQYLFKASKNEDGTWSIVNEQPDNVRTLYYSDGNNDFAAYNEDALTRYNGKLPFLFISETSDPNASDEQE